MSAKGLSAAIRSHLRLVGKATVTELAVATGFDREDIRKRLGQAVRYKNSGFIRLPEKKNLKTSPQSRMSSVYALKEGYCDQRRRRAA